MFKDDILKPVIYLRKMIYFLKILLVKLYNLLYIAKEQTSEIIIKSEILNGFRQAPYLQHC